MSTAVDDVTYPKELQDQFDEEVGALDGAPPPAGETDDAQAKPEQEPQRQPERAIPGFQDEGEAEDGPEADERQDAAVAEEQRQPDPSEEVSRLRDELERVSQRYRSLQGMMKSLRDRAEAAEKRTQELEGMRGDLERKRMESDEDFLVEKMKELDVPVELLDVGKPVAIKAIRDAERLRMLEANGNGHRQAAEPAAAQTPAPGSQTFHADLTKLVPDWMAHNKDSRFLGWLNERIPGLPGTRHDALLEAYTMGDADAAARMFQDWKAESVKTGKATAARPSAMPKDRAVAGGPRANAPAGRPSKPSSEVEADDYVRRANDLRNRGKHKEADLLDRLSDEYFSDVAQGLGG